MDFRRLKHLRTLNLLTQSQLAEQLEVTERTIQNWENGVTTPSKVSCRQIADLFFNGSSNDFNDYFKVVNNQPESTIADNQNHSVEGASVSQGRQNSEFSFGETANCANTPKNKLENWDFTLEEQIIADALQNGTLDTIYAHPLRNLFDAEKIDSVGIAICSILGSLRYISSVSASCILGELATVMNSVVNLQIGQETDSLLHDLTFRLTRIKSDSKLPESCRHSLGEIITDLQNLEHTDDAQRYLDIFRRCFFALSSYTDKLSGNTDFSYALSDLFVPISEISYTASDRRHLFYALYHCAQYLTTSLRR